MQRIRNTIMATLTIAVLVVALAVQTTGKAKADTYNWIDAPQLYLTKVRDVTSADIPSTVWSDGNIDCTQDGTVCGVSTQYGKGTVGKVKFTTDSQYVTVQDYNGNFNTYWPITNSNSALTTFQSSNGWEYVFFYGDFPDSVSINGSGYYQLNHAADARLNDKSGNAQLVDLNSLGYSNDGNWIVVTRPNVADLAVNTATHDVLPFTGSITYGSGNNPRYVQAITGDGNYAAVAQENYTNFSVFDLSTCGTVPNTINGPVSCDSRNLNQSNFLQTQIPGYVGTFYSRFTDNDHMDLYVKYLDSGTYKYAEYTLSHS